MKRINSKLEDAVKELDAKYRNRFDTIKPLRNDNQKEAMKGFEVIKPKRKKSK